MALGKRYGPGGGSVRRVKRRTTLAMGDRDSGKIILTRAGKGVLQVGGSALYRARLRNYLRRRRYGAEWKYFDTRQNDVTVPTGGGQNGSIVNVALGTGEQQRIGKKIIVRYIQIRGEIKMPNSPNTTIGGNAQPQSDIVRVSLVMDKQTNGSVANYSQIYAFGDTSSGQTPVVDIRAFRTMDNGPRFKVLMDRVIHVNNQNYTGGAGLSPGNSKWFQFYKKVYIPVDYSGNTGADTEFTCNGLRMYSVSSNGLATVNWIARVKYSDEG